MSTILPVVGTSITLPTQDGSTYNYYPPPAYIPSYFQYQNVNADKDLQYKVTIFFQDELIDWMEHDKSYKSVKKYLRYIKSGQGYDIVHKLLRLFVKNGNTNWYDLKLQYQLVKDFIKYKLRKLN
jgi:hypothetical protein